ncbi:PREDICTED: programmed cell death protein 2 [Dufourea novaeangliae]|uniref:Programmed cell death protein 2 n=1 Tax=Dufourea novaeangliae TaxID=178035 RepID=A0A154P6H0_DUFNO|nr:PREDICTED: programmed cell death protein 2 [Dufourea novaeangliae]KZC07423.1 Programmed cell death protein 2 [Dufourea novaeangliae]
MRVDLGFVEKCETWRLESRFFPSKVGGKPAWLNLKDIPGEKDVQCEYCEEPCIFLCQIYAPYEDNETAFHRSVYIFICQKPECCKLNKNGNLKVFRSQLPKKNEFYPSEPPVEEPDWRTDISIIKWVRSCKVCGIFAPNHCSKCKCVNYCCRAHQIFDWKCGHKESCGRDPLTIQNSKLLFPEYEIVIEAENEREDNDESNCEKEEEEIKKYETMIESGQAGTLQNEDVQSELLSMANQKEDEIFSEFRLTIDQYPDQILRYNRGGKVLYISAENKINEVPKCSECNEERQFEFQIMPQLLNFLNLKNAYECIDWGILAVFTCINSCTPKNGYVTEYVWKQDIIETNSDNI